MHLSKNDTLYMRLEKVLNKKNKLFAESCMAYVYTNNLCKCSIWHQPPYRLLARELTDTIGSSKFPSGQHSIANIDRHRLHHPYSRSIYLFPSHSQSSISTSSVDYADNVNISYRCFYLLSLSFNFVVFLILYICI